MINHADILDALTKAAAYDASHTPKTSNILVAAWLEHFERYAPQVERDDLLAAVTEYGREPHDRMLQPADLSTLARVLRRDQLDRTPIDDPRRLELEARADAKADVTDLRTKQRQAAAAEHQQRLARVISRFNPDDPDDAKALRVLEPLARNALTVPCPFCHAAVGRPCTIGGLPGVKRADIRKTPHPSRLDAVQGGRP